MEEYSGVKFEYSIVEGKIPENRIMEYLELDRTLKKFLDTEKNEGNMSMRIKGGFLIKRTGAKMTDLNKGDISMVTGIEDEKIIAIGQAPSSEARMHDGIYRTNPEVRVILHFHNDEILDKISCSAIGPFPYGTTELANAAAECSIKHKFFKINKHGFVIVAKNSEELLNKLENVVKTKIT